MRREGINLDMSGKGSLISLLLSFKKGSRKSSEVTPSQNTRTPTLLMPKQFPSAAFPAPYPHTNIHHRPLLTTPDYFIFLPPRSTAVSWAPLPFLPIPLFASRFHPYPMPVRHCVWMYCSSGCNSNVYSMFYFIFLPSV